MDNYRCRWKQKRPVLGTPKNWPKYAYGGDAGNRTPDTTDMSRML
jgi:hypothetical protein